MAKQHLPLRINLDATRGPPCARGDVGLGRPPSARRPLHGLPCVLSLARPASTPRPRQQLLVHKRAEDRGLTSGRSVSVGPVAGGRAGGGPFAAARRGFPEA